MTEPTIGINDFARRHTAGSRFSHFSGGDYDLIMRVRAGFQDAQEGNREGVLLVPVNPDGFFSGVTKPDADTPLMAEFSARREGEQPYVHVTARAQKAPANSVKVVIYSRSALGEDGANSTDCDWEIISINASASMEDEPTTPVAMARNFLHAEGGTKTDYSAEDFARSIEYWSQHVMVREQ